MLKTYKTDSITANFLTYLKSLQLCQNSLRFYKSDLKHFFLWMASLLKRQGVFVSELQEIVPFLKPELAHKYRQSLLDGQTAVKTLNRRLSTLRRFADYLFTHDFLSLNFAADIENVSLKSQGCLEGPSLTKLLTGFENHLRAEKASGNTIKNYLADIHHFSVWYTQHA